MFIERSLPSLPPAEESVLSRKICSHFEHNQLHPLWTTERESCFLHGWCKYDIIWKENSEDSCPTTSFLSYAVVLHPHSRFVPRKFLELHICWYTMFFLMSFLVPRSVHHTQIGCWKRSSLIWSLAKSWMLLFLVGMQELSSKWKI